jgi:hypothetical protein
VVKQRDPHCPTLERDREVSYMRKLILVGLLALSSLWSQDRPELNGVWRLDTAHSTFSETRLKSQTLTIKQEDESIKIDDTATEESGKDRKLEYECNTNGKECSLKVNGQPLKVSAYYNGAVLVLIEQRKGNDLTTRKRMKTSEDGNTLTIEIANLARPGQKPDSLVYTKGAPAK